MARQITEAKASELAECNKGKSRAEWIDGALELLLKGSYSIHHDECGAIYTNIETVCDAVAGEYSQAGSAIAGAYLGNPEKLDCLIADEAKRQLQNLADYYEIGE